MASSLQSPGGLATGAAKLQAVTKLLSTLAEDLQKATLQPQEREAALGELKVYGRDPRNADPIYTKEGIETIARHAFDGPSKSPSQNALGCLANAMTLKADTRQKFLDLGYEAKACAALKQDSVDLEFLVSRVIFLTTYAKNLNYVALVDDHGLSGAIVQNLARHADRARQRSSGAGKARLNPMEDMALTETSKLLFNISHFCPERASSFIPAIPHILVIVTKRDLPTTKVLDPPFGSLTNALLNLQLGDENVRSALCPDSEPEAVANRLVAILDLAMRQYDDAELEPTVTPLIGVISQVHENARDAVRDMIRKKLLPTEQDRQDVLGKGESLASRLLKNTTNPVAPELRKAISHLLFEMSDKDATKFVENVGYGFASGFLFQNDIPIPEGVAGAQGATGSAGPGGRPVNPITGQFLDKEQFPELPEMTQEEKEREAERLFVLFERLKRTGIIDVQNPVEAAYGEGRVQELDDDSEDTD